MFGLYGLPLLLSPWFGYRLAFPIGPPPFSLAPFINKYAPHKPAKTKHDKKTNPTAVPTLDAAWHVVDEEQKPSVQHPDLHDSSICTVLEYGMPEQD